MKNRIFALFLLLVIFALLFCEIGCSDSDLDDSIFEAVICGRKIDTKLPVHIYYKSVQYPCVGKSDFFQVENENDITVSWSGNKWFGEVLRYYSYTAESPIYIYDDDGFVFFLKDYDYRADVFVVDGTDKEIVFSEICGSSQSRSISSNPTRLPIHSKAFPGVKMVVELEFVNGGWSLSFEGEKNTWSPSAAFLKIIEEVF